MASANIDRDNPWPGLAAYDESAQAYFSGREAETAELVRRIADEPVTVLFGKSGLGKSSLLKAGVFPLLRQRGLLPVPLRLHFGGGAADALEQIAAALFAAFDAEQIEYPPIAAGEPLWDYLHRAGLRFWTTKVRPVQPVLVLDQFEEVFTLGRGASGIAESLRERLADLAENRIPAALAARVEDGAALPAALDVHARPYKLVFSLREDFLPELEGWVASMPSLRRNRMRLLPLQREQALQAVCNPHTAHLIDAALGRRIVDYLASGAARPETEGGTDSGASVEPALLSLVCRGINETRKREGKACFDAALFEAGKGRIVADFYRESLADQPRRVARFIEDELVTEQGFRNSYSLLAATEGGNIQTTEVATLVDRRLLRVEHQLGTERLELTHDLLTHAVLAQRAGRRAAERAAAQRRWLWRIGGAAAAVFSVVALIVWQQVDRLQSERAAADSRAAQDRAFLAEIKLTNGRLVEAERLAQAAQATAEGQNRALIDAYKEIGARTNQALAEAERANQERLRADTASRFARSREIAARAAAVMTRDRELALLLGVEALHIADTPEARAVLLDAARFVWPTTTLLPGQLGGDPQFVGLDASGRQLAVVATQGDRARLGLWDLSTRAPAQPRWQREFALASVGYAAFTPDGKRLLLGRPGGIDQIDVQTGEPLAPSLRLPPGAGDQPPTQLAVSTDGRWLAAALPTGMALVRDLRQPAADWETVSVAGAEAISISDDGQRIAIVSDRPLAAAVVERDDTGGWSRRALDLTSCAKPQSVTTAAAYAVATWRAQACSQSLDPGAAADTASTGQDESAIADTVPSIFGPSFIAILANGDLKVGVGNPARPESTSEVKGVHLATGGNMTSGLSVNASGTRAAWLTWDGVRVVSLAGYKLLLAEYPGGAIDSSDGRRIVQARAVRGGAMMWMTPIAAVSEGRELPRPSWRVPLERLPELLEVQGDAVVVTLRSGPRQALTTRIHDLATGAVRAGPYAGGAQRVGPERSLLLLQAEDGAQDAAEDLLLRLADGRVLGRWDAAGGTRLRLSPGANALLVLQTTPTEPRSLTAQAYTLRGDQLRPAGRVIDLPLTATASVAIDDAATLLYEQRAIRGAGVRPHREDLRWPLAAGRETSARDPAAAPPPPQAPAAAAAPGAATAPEWLRELPSPSGRLVVRQSRLADGALSTLLVRREGGATLLNFGARELGEMHFSDDERWLAFVEADALQVLDLRTLQPLLTWRGLGVKRAEFTRSGGLLRVVLRDDGNTLLVPIDRTLLDGFARWLVTRELTPGERCEHGLDANSCNAMPAAATRKLAQARPR